jgi:Skp family chaperone for outer membrane proteins
VKKSIWALGLAVLLTSGLVGRLQAQQPSAGTRVALVNVGFVFSKYEKAKFYKAELENTLKPFKDEGEKIKAEMIKYAEPLKKNPTIDAKTRESYEQYLLSLKRKMEDLDMQARKLIGKKQEDQIVMLYKEVAGAVQGYAQANGIHLVLGFGEQIEGDLYSFLNINRKMQGMDLGSTTPFFQLGGVDISQAIVDTLNAHYRAAGGQAAPAVPATPVSTQK